MTKSNRQAAMELLGLAKELVGSVWEAPNADRKNWRKRKTDGTYEYRDTPPEDLKPTQNKQAPSGETKVVQNTSPEKKKPEFGKRVITYKKYVLLDKPKLKETLDKGYCSFISAGRNGDDPKEKDMSPYDPFFHERHEKLRKELEDSGFAYTEVVGHYGSIENTFMVFHDDTVLSPKTEKSIMVHHNGLSGLKKARKKLEGLATKFNQNSVLHNVAGRNDMVFTTGEHAGKHCGGEGWSVVPKAKDYYTDIKYNEKQHTKFSLDIHECYDNGYI